MKRKKGIFICFTGMDGVGKTTLAKALLALMREEGFEGRYVHSRLNPFISKPVMLAGLALFLRGKEKHQSYDEYASRKKRLFENRFLSTIYLYFISFDYLLQILFKIKIPLMRGINIICDRYIYDTVILDLTMDLNYSINKTNRVIANWLIFLPKPDLVFLADAPEEIVFTRKNDIPSLDYLKEIRSIFLKVGKNSNMIVLDSSKPIEEVEEVAVDKVREFLSLSPGCRAIAETRGVK